MPRTATPNVQFSLRSILIVMGSVAGLCALAFAPHPLSGIVPSDVLALGDAAIYLLCWAIAGASIGYDFVGGRKGWIMGALVAVIVGVASGCVLIAGLSLLQGFQHLGK